MEELDRYPWSGHAVLVGNILYDWMNPDYVLNRFGRNRRHGRDAYRQFVSDGFFMGRAPELVGGGLVRSKGGWSNVISMRRRSESDVFDARILGEGRFVSAVLKETEEKKIRQLKWKQPIPVGSMMEEECRRAGISSAELKKGSRRQPVSVLRTTIARRCIEEFGLSAAEVARQLGVSTSAILKAVRRES